MLDGFKKFILRGNVVDLAVGVVIGAAFGGVVTAFTKDLLTPLIAAIAGKCAESRIDYLQLTTNQLVKPVTVDNPPVTLKFNVCAEDASIVSTMVL